MKKLFVMMLILGSTLAQAAVVTVVEKEMVVNPRNTLTDTRFYVDQNTHEGFVSVSVSEERPVYNDGWGLPGEYGPYPGGYYPYPGGYYPRPMPTPVLVSVYEDTIKVDGLMLMGDKVVFHAPEGSVDCGTLGVSRVLKRPTIYLSGSCALNSSWSIQNGLAKLTVTLKTK